MFHSQHSQKTASRLNTLASVTLLLASVYAGTAIAADPVILTFSTVGDSRQDPLAIDPSVKQNSMVGVGGCPTPSGNAAQLASGKAANPGLSGQDCKWLQNTAAWSRIIRGIQAQKANLLFFNGDMVMGYGKAGVPVNRTSNGSGETVINAPSVSQIVTSDLMQFYQQYGFWRGMVAPLMETGTYVVPVPGNHETQCKRCGKTAQPENENAWRENMADLILDTTRMTNLLGQPPTHFSANNNPYIDQTTGLPYSPSNPDSITSDQKQLSFSFDVGTSHFAVINTDPAGHDGYAPTVWLDADLSAAQANGVQHIFVFGHKPAYYYAFPGAPTPPSVYLNNAQTFWNVIVKHHATYFCGHEHIYNVSSQASTDPQYPGTAYQVLVGSGGSPFETPTATSNPDDRMYAWATVKIFQSGKVTLDTYGFDDTLATPTLKLASYLLP